MPISKLRFTNVGPFDEIEFEFHQQVNVFTGPNNSGKSTVLWVLGEILVYPFGFPTKLLRSEEAAWEGHFVFDQKTQSFSGLLPISGDALLDTVVGILEQVGYTTFVPALRQSTDFRTTGPMVGREKIADSQVGRLSAGEILTQRVANLEDTVEGRLVRFSDRDPRLSARLGLIRTNALLVTDEAVIQKIIELDYRAYRRQEPTIRSIVEKIAEIASEITEGFPVQFLGVGEDDEGLFPQFRTQDGDVPLNVLSQGTQSIIQWLAHLLIGYAEYYEYPANLEEKPGVLIIDEIDAHLHPSWQRRIIPTLTKYFPNLQIFCSTHSPLMLAGLKAGQVQLLKRDERGKVTVSRNETDIVGWSADEILRNFLDVSSPTDLATTEQLDRLQELRRRESPSSEEVEELEQLRHTVNQDLLAGPMAPQVEHFTELLKQASAESATPPEPVAAPRARATRRRRTPSE